MLETVVEFLSKVSVLLESVAFTVPLLSVFVTLLELELSADVWLESEDWLEVAVTFEVVELEVFSVSVPFYEPEVLLLVADVLESVELDSEPVEFYS